VSIRSTPRRHAARLAAVALVATLAATANATPTAAADALPPRSQTDQYVHDILADRAKNPILGSDTTGLVTDATTGRILWSQRRLSRQLPASTTKLVTAVNSLETFGPAHRFTTEVRTSADLSRVILVGGGDPSLSGTNLSALASDTAAVLTSQAATAVTVHVDDSLFPKPTRAYGWLSAYVGRDIRPVRALVVNQHRAWDTSIDAGKVFAAKLRAHGIVVSNVVRGRAPVDSLTVAQVHGQSLDVIVATMLRSSDNDYAEALHRLVARQVGYRTTWWGASVAQREVLAKLGVHLGTSKLYDGSGLSRAGRLTAAQLVAVMNVAFNSNYPNLASLRSGSLPIAGRTGTLGPTYKRFTTAPTNCAAGLIEAKTGTLRGAITLTGFARGADGQIKLFAFLVNGMPSTLSTRRAVDRLAASVTGCF
jgi:D-alanyl-D-alanine carboxypeptidase/D-alanyl-D-alanine-endopeptidase (penicillin-binding protein 4)